MRWLQFFSKPTSAQLERRRREEFRSLLNKPHTGATIYCADLRMSVEAGLSMQLWRWLVSRGWRELDDLARRNRMRAVPSSAVMALFDATPELWEDLLAAALKQAIRKPTITSPVVRAAA